MSDLFKNDENLVKKASYLKFLARELADSLKTGNFRSLFRGQGIEFEGVRDYIRGDDVRSIDWNVTARMGHPFVKVFEEERELQVLLILDNSASMMIKNDKKSKFEVARYASALITIACELNSCSIGAIFFDGVINFCTKPFFSKNQIMLILNKLFKLNENPVKGSVLNSALIDAGRILKKRSLVFVFSDFCSDGWQKSMIALAKKNDVLAFKLCDSVDYEFFDFGSVVFKDAESDIKMLLPTASKKFKKDWHNYNQQRLQNWKEFCLKHGIIPVIMNTKDDPLEILNNALKKGR